MSTSDPKARGRRGMPPMVLLGVVVLVALLIAYLSDCIPGLGAGGEPGAPSKASEPAADSPAAVEKVETGDARITLVVQGDSCRQGSQAATSCTELCASLERSHPDSARAVEIEVDATEGRHGTVEQLRKCLEQAGFTRVRIHAE